MAIPSRSSPAAWSGRPPAIRAKRGLELPHDGQLLGTKLRRHEAQDAHAPGPTAELPGGVTQQVSHFRFAQKCERQKRQAAALRNGPGKPGDVADPGHRALQDRDSACRGRRPGAKILPAAGPPGQRRFRRRSPARRPGRFRRRSRTCGRVDPRSAASWPTGMHCPSPQPTWSRTAASHAAPSSLAAARSRASASEPGRAKTRTPSPADGRDDGGLTAIPAGDPLAPFRAKR